ncbi:DUF4783 domain-containing protein [Sphingobacterium sp. N143]|nr:DUF4783 domain-containing protein [Sphingobacterium sp. N143]
MRFLSHYIFLLVFSLFVYMKVSGHGVKGESDPIQPHMSLESDFLGNISEELKAYLKEGNAKNIAKYFGSNLTLSILGENGVYTKYQSEIMLNTFFNQHKPKSVKLTQSSNANNGYQYFTFLLATEQANYRVFIKIGTGSNNHTIEELRVDKN